MKYENLTPKERELALHIKNDAELDKEIGKLKQVKISDIQKAAEHYKAERAKPTDNIFTLQNLRNVRTYFQIENGRRQWEEFGRENDRRIGDVTREHGKIEIVNELAGAIATFYSPNDAAKFLFNNPHRYVKFSFANGRYDLFKLAELKIKKGAYVDGIITAVPIINGSYKFSN